MPIQHFRRLAERLGLVTHDEVTRKVTRVTDKHVICECGRRFIINDNLKIKKFNF